MASERLEKTKELVDVAAARGAVESARNLAAYLEKVRPDLAESVASIRALGKAINDSIPQGLRVELGE